MRWAAPYSEMLVILSILYLRCDNIQPGHADAQHAQHLSILYLRCSRPPPGCSRCLTFLSILYLRCRHCRSRGGGWRNCRLSILYLRCRRGGAGDEGALKDLSILYLRCCALHPRLCAERAETFNSLFEMLCTDRALSGRRRRRFQFSI